MINLVFDTCFNKSYIVLRKDNEILVNKIIKSTDSNYHSVFLIPSVIDILRENSIMPEDIDAIGTNIGPGSFTGIRVGITVARVLAQQINAKLVGVNSLRILAGINDFNHDTVTILDARKNKVYISLSYNDVPKLMDKDSLLKQNLKDSVIISDTSIHNFLKENGIYSINYEQKDENIGLYLSSIVCEELNKGQGDFHWAKLKPLYIQPPSITKSKV